MAKTMLRLVRRYRAIPIAVLVVLAACTPPVPTVPPTADGVGFNRTTGGVDLLRAGGYKFRLDGSAPANLRNAVASDLDYASSHLQWHTGLPFSRSTTPFNGGFMDVPPDGVITVSIVTAAEMAGVNGCGGANVIGCGGVAKYSGGRVLSGRIAILDSHIASASDYHLKTTILHEAGHALNLAHKHDPYQGGLQTMHPTGGANTGDYRHGDINGLKYMAAGSLNQAAAREGDSVHLVAVATP
ncbi:MAG: hypothetical protein M5U31_10515 [Acidimicrobiia bacterium]|nr:hypothetical protein [Acidimicrobiia bacterium]